MKHGSLFSGIGGFDLAAEWMGWDNVFHCEWNEFGQKILKHYWPKAISYGDITKTDFSIHRGTIDVLTGGFPCQPYSLAGKRKGKEDERHLWPQMLRAVREIQPSWVVGENVPGIINWSGGLVFHEVQTDLETEGYEVFPVILPACGVNAPHKRERIWFVAKRINANSTSNGISEQNRENARVKREGIAINESINGGQFQTVQYDRLDDILQPASDTAIEGLEGSKKTREQQEHPKYKRSGQVRNVTNSTNERLQGSISANSSQRKKSYDKQFNGCGRIQQTWNNFPTQPPLCSRDDGFSSRLAGITFSKHRNESIKGYGNAIVPQVAYQIFKTIEEINEEICKDIS
jgi:DNA (cytosine-5)-methyltransferase 1